MENESKREKKLKPISILFLGFLAMILFGSILLVLPFATKAEGHISYIDALFVSASASCVTGLSPVPTFETWTLFGQIVILILIQIGGLGFMTLITFVYWIVKRDIGLYSKTILMQSAGTYSFGNVKPLLRRIIIFTGAFETIGAILLSIFIWRQDGGPFTAMHAWRGFFTSVSAFCNAGFDIFPSDANGMASLSGYATNPGVIITVCCLIIFGGLGFLVWSDMIDTKGHFGKLQMHSKIVLVATFFLILISTISFYIFEFTNIGNPGHIIASQDWNVGQKILNAFFLAVTPRTAGFYSFDMSQLTSAGKTLSVVLMFIGGNSGSTAGGLKVTTIVVILANLIANARSKDEVTLFKQRVNNEAIRQSGALLMSYLMLLVVSVMIIISIEPNDAVSLEGVIFESVSAIATVGLTLGITSSLGIVSKIILILLMYVGRLGAFGLFNFIMGKSKNNALMHAEGRIMVG